MNRTKARCVIAHSERLKLLIALAPFVFLRSFPSTSMRVDCANLLPVGELLHAERDYALAIVQARCDVRHVLREGRYRYGPQFERTGLVDHVYRRAGAAIQDRCKR